MNFVKSVKYILILIVLLSSVSCTQLFETTEDIQAQTALQDLMEIQDKFFQENGRYAKNLVEIEKYNLKYHTGIVYLEISSAGKTGYRAISLPAESSTARVFAFDSEKGGYYEMDEEEVSHYVLGSLNHIRKQQKDAKKRDMVSIVLIAGMVLLGFRYASKARHKNRNMILGAYFATLIALAWSLAVLNYMNEDVVFTPLISGGLIVALVIAFFSLTISGLSMVKDLGREETGFIVGVNSCSIIISLFAIWATVYTWITYYPK